MRILLLSLCVVLFPCAVYADGPADNMAEKVRRIPALGIEVPEAVQAELNASLKTLQDALQLTPDAVAEVEAKLKPFSEEGVDAPPQVGRPPIPRGRPPVR